jgi:YD repeat-containing protein
VFLHFSQRSRRLLVAAAVTAGAALTASAAFAGSVVYAYDNLGRLSRATYSNGVVIAYAYDAAGNRTSVVITGAP